MKRTLGICFSLMLGFLAATAPTHSTAQNISRAVPVDDGFVSDRFRWQGIGGGYDFRMNLIAVDGRLELCGVGAVTNAQLRQTIMGLLHGAELKMNGQTILRDFTFFARANRPRDLNGAMANCKATSAAVPRSQPEFDIDWPDGTFRN